MRSVSTVCKRQQVVPLVWLSLLVFFQVNGKDRMHGSPAKMIFDIPTLIEAVRPRPHSSRRCAQVLACKPYVGRLRVYVLTEAPDPPKRLVNFTSS